MLPKDKRLNLKKDFRWVAEGKKINSKFVTIFIKVGNNTFPKVGIAVSNHYFKKAIQRSRTKRLVSAAVEALYSKLPDGINIVALPKQGIIDVKSPDVLSDLQQALKNAKVID